MLKFFTQKLTPEMARLKTEEFIKIRATRALQETAETLCTGLTPERIQNMVDAKLRLADLLKETGWKIPKVTLATRAGVNYLKSIPDEAILDLLAEVVPDQVVILRQHPDFAHNMIEDLKTAAGG